MSSTEMMEPISIQRRRFLRRSVIAATAAPFLLATFGTGSVLAAEHEAPPEAEGEATPTEPILLEHGLQTGDLFIIDRAGSTEVYVIDGATYRLVPDSATLAALIIAFDTGLLVIHDDDLEQLPEGEPVPESTAPEFGAFLEDATVRREAGETFTAVLEVVTEPSEPSAPSELSEPSEASEPSEPSAPSEPSEPSAPSEPSEPSEPS